MAVVFCTDAQKQAQAAVAQLLEHKWNCTLHPFPTLAVIDYFAEREGRIIALVEIKTRENSVTQYPDVFLSYAKWTHLSFAGIGFGCPAYFVVRFQDAIRYIEAKEVDASDPQPDGRPPRPGSANDIEKMLYVPISQMLCL